MPPTAESLTERECEILACLLQRLSNQEIADKLYLSVATVKWYNTQIFEKLGVKNRTEVARLFGNHLPNLAPPQHPKTLPPHATPFIGRAAELLDLAHLLAAPDVRIITILAPGGMGKTRLAIEAAAQNALHFAAGACFVALAQLAAPTDLVVAIGGVLGMTFHGQSKPSQQLLDFLRSQALLLVLDNFEQLVAGAALVAEIVMAAPAVKVLITSREKLHLSGETIYTLGGMHAPALALHQEIDHALDPLAADAVQLFLFHARRVRRDLAIDDTASLARIAHLTEGMPLGLVLAAGWADVLSPRQIADEISRGMELLHQEMRDIPARHRSMRAVFDPTWERLSTPQRARFMRLSIFRGGFTHEAAAAVAGVDVPMLAEFAGKSLIQPQSNLRFTSHELLRQYGEGHLNASHAANATQAAHCAFFMDFLAQRQADVIGHRQAAALDEIHADFENIRRAWSWAIAHHEVDAIQRALECLAIAGELTGRLLETRTLLQQGADRLGGRAPALRDRMLVRLARIDGVLRNNITVEEVEAILARARARQDPLEVIWSLWGLGGYESNITGRDGHARRYFEELIALCETTGHDFFRAHALTGISWRYANDGEITRAAAALREAIAIRHRIGDVRNLDYVTAQLAWLSFDQLREPVRAEMLLDEQIAMQKLTGATSILPILYALKAWMALWRDEVAAAVALAQTGVEIARSYNYLGGQSMAQGALGLAKLYQGDYQEAEQLCRNVEVSGFSALSAFIAHWILAFARYMLHDKAGSQRSLKTSLEIACRYKSPTFQGMCLLLLAVVKAQRGDPAHAAEYLAFCLAQPAYFTPWLQRWPLLSTLRAGLQRQLGEEHLAAAWARGAVLDLNRAAAAELAAMQPLDD